MPVAESAPFDGEDVAAKREGKDRRTKPWSRLIVINFVMHNYFVINGLKWLARSQKLASYQTQSHSFYLLCDVVLYRSLVPILLVSRFFLRNTVSTFNHFRGKYRISEPRSVATTIRVCWSDSQFLFFAPLWRVKTVFGGQRLRGRLLKTAVTSDSASVVILGPSSPSCSQPLCLKMTELVGLAS